MNFEVILHFVKDSVLIMLAFIEFFYQNCLTNERRKKENKFRNPESHSVFMKCQRTYVLKKKHVKCQPIQYLRILLMNYSYTCKLR